LHESGNRTEPGRYSVVRPEREVSVLKDGRFGRHLGEDWIFAEKDWATLRLRWVDPNYVSYFGCSEDQLIGRTTSQIFGPVRGADLFQHEETVQATMEATCFRELFSVSGTLVQRYAVRFPIFSEEDL